MLSRVASLRKDDAGGAAGSARLCGGRRPRSARPARCSFGHDRIGLRSPRPTQTSVVFLGDLIDRGPQSAEVVERLRRYDPTFATPVFLMGNHEEVLLRILSGDTAILEDWLRFGGAECARSYGVDPVAIECSGPAAALKTLRRAIPKAHVKFLSSFADSASFGDYLFVHAGIRPGVPIAHQRPQDLRWIRHPFLEDETRPWADRRPRPHDQ